MHLDKQRHRCPQDLVFILWQSTEVNVINFGQRSQSNEADDDQHGVVDGAEEKDASHLSHESTEGLHEGY